MKANKALECELPSYTGNSPEKHPAGSGPYAKFGGI